MPLPRLLLLWFGVLVFGFLGGWTARPLFDKRIIVMLEPAPAGMHTGVLMFTDSEGKLTRAYGVIPDSVGKGVDGNTR